MKKIIFVLAVALIAGTNANAQKQQGGEKNLEVQFTPLGGSPIGINGVRLRIFKSESSAIRIGFGFGGSTATTVNRQQVDALGSDNKIVVLPELYDIDKSFNFSIRPGYEMHFAGTDRLSPYVGGELIFAIGSEKLTREFNGANNADDQTKPEKFVTWEMTRKNGTTTFGLNAVAGVDFYFADNIYMGAEIGFGFQSKKYNDRETEASSADAWKYSNGENGASNAQGDSDFDQAGWNETITAIEYTTIIGPGDGKFKDFGWGPSFQSTIRLGWLFN